MNAWLFSFLLFGCIVGGYCIAAMRYIYKVSTWRIRWIELEHETARLLKREPRDINSVFKD